VNARSQLQLRAVETGCRNRLFRLSVDELNAAQGTFKAKSRGNGQLISNRYYGGTKHVLDSFRVWINALRKIGQRKIAGPEILMPRQLAASLWRYGAVGLRIS
jgi:hypothetical protein